MLYWYFFAAVIGFPLFGLMTGCTTNKTTGPAPIPPNIVHFSKDTLFWNVPFTDTIHAKDLSVSSSDGKGVTIHLVDSKQGMSTTDSIFSWTPKDTGRVYVNATVCGTNGYCDTLRDTLMVKYASNSKRRFHFKTDTIPRFVRFIDTLRADSGSIARFGATGFSWHCIDSAKNMVLHDSIFQWTSLDTGFAQFAMAQCVPNGPCDTLLGSLYVASGGAALPSLSFRFSKDTLCLSEIFLDTLGASRLSASKSIGKINSFRLIDAGKRAMQLTDSVFLWIPGDLGLSSVSMVVGDTAGHFYSIQDTFFIHQCSIDRFCPSYTHKDDVAIGRQSDLPAGFFVYAYEYDPAHSAPGLYISDIRNFSPKLIPNTEYEVPLSIHISDDGKWILYVNSPNSSTSDACIISLDGSQKYKVPLSGVKVDKVDFYRNGPYGVEICYTTTDTVRQEIHAIQVKLDSVPTFGTIRTIADLTGSFRIEPYYPISVVKDQILGGFSLLWQGVYVLRMGFLTIPDGGRGIALPQHMFKWAYESGKQVWGCNSTMSPDGSLCLYIPGVAGMGGAIGNCIPTEHLGFVVTPFRRSTDPAITVDDHIDKFGLSINWCPPQYRFGKWDEMDFHGWYFGNNNDLVIGSQTGTMTPAKGVWMVNWKNNVWTQLTPPDSVMDIYWQSVYFTGKDTGNVLDPHYHVVRPNGGEQFTVGQACTVTVSSQRDANAGIRLKIQNGKYSFLLPGVTSSINPHVDSTFIFAIPDSFSIDQSGGNTLRVSSASDSCRMCVMDYNVSTGFQDCSDNFFSIKPAH
jgi:hypothetical protein